MCDQLCSGMVMLLETSWVFFFFWMVMWKLTFFWSSASSNARPFGLSLFTMAPWPAADGLTQALIVSALLSAKALGLSASTVSFFASNRTLWPVAPSAQLVLTERVA